MTHALDGGITLEAIAKAWVTLDEADRHVTSYVKAAMAGYPTPFVYLHRSGVHLEGHGRVWRDQRGHRVLKRIRCQYGDWQRLDEIIGEAKAHYDSKRQARA